MNVLNEKNEEYSTLKPQAAYVGPDIDPLNRRIVEQLDDIKFQHEQDDAFEPEEIKNIKVLLLCLNQS